MNARVLTYGIMKRKKVGIIMYWTLVICLIIVVIILTLAVVTTSKAYGYKHTVDPLPEEQDDKQQAGPKQPQ
ncbi:hypothetical protein B1691_05255 [Geobacillus sp. 47C-IIb]|jgi:flagellar basal body-associated protein FliL|nr:hypothetical protein GD3902_12345 [Geobacillus thermodenitrificans]ARP43870.1 hypothetical protein GTHT12_02348 [Geobacillus thermodenitrificans]ATO38093.1 hypothetical protein GTID1_13425 [Geobacillus thermodenitrificans]OQP10574.1 hypothetical protein B1691_05255 [Geobacillus sp. 47C-IIb]QNU32313.1 YtzI protein [Geobacillus sp. 47C-IIb]